MAKYDGWEPLRDNRDPKREKTLGSGGQGTVYLARSPERAAKRLQTHNQARALLEQVNRGRYEPMELATCLLELAGPDPVENLGALKQFRIPSDDKSEEARAISRLESEIRALRSVNHQAVLKLLDANISQRFIVTEYHRRGSLSENLNLYSGNVMAAQNAFRTLVEGVAAIQAQNAIHRDIKPANIFVAESGDLVLGDFGIVFFDTGAQTRLTKTIGELVGSHWWMPPWAYTYDRIAMDKVTPSFDVYPLAKVLWSMISGRNGFMREEYDSDDNNLAKIFPEDPNMLLVNELLAKCVARHEKDCLSSASGLLSEVGKLIRQIEERRGYRPDRAPTWPCPVCQKGNYGSVSTNPTLIEAKVHALRAVVIEPVNFAVFVCDHCGHAALFRTDLAGVRP